MARIGYNDLVEKVSRRRLRSASVQLGALTALAVTLSGCNQVGDDDDCDSRPSTPRPRSLALAAYAPATVPAATTAGSTAGSTAPDVLPERGGFGTHLASCGG
ncbi:hypothetical protein [Plantactinospora sp. KLBMP9567]|uniref:hypothetical protein n=1 Tax=Plantactinospora sp. KLBMP9567 TaxID=3085900 RepID=UPI0029822493|nr:hypothetical protein [Plantactinospora sp. KLBMP9567]MDW5328698.1 hypothetical protein [Plantactinospora sp. KLBMP9567]